MPLKLEHNHPTLQLKESVSEFGKEFLDSYNFSYFQFLRCYKDGSFSLLLNNTDAFLYFLDHDIPVLSSFEEEHHKFASYVFSWDEELPQLPVQIVKEKFNMHQGFTIVKRHKDFYDMIGFAMKKPRSNPMSFYANHLKIMGNFVDDFTTKNIQQVKIVENQKITPPVHMRDKNRKEMCLPDKPSRYLAYKADCSKTYLTHQEIFCLQLLNEGKSYKEIAHQLSISPRTVEAYLNRVKLRTGFTTRSGFSKLLSVCE